MQSENGDVVRVPHEKLRDFVYRNAVVSGIPEDQAIRLAGLLIASDLRGVLSHGSRQMGRYWREISTGGINPTPCIRVDRETDTSLIVDGDGGLGYFPAWDGMHRAIDKARRSGMSSLVTRRHGHIGAAGIYTRMTLEHDLLCFATSGVHLTLNPGDTIIRSAGASPMSFSAPGKNESSIVLDCGVTHDIQGDPIHLNELVALAPGIVTRAIGFGAICQTWGGLLTGLDVNQVIEKYPKANQGAMFFMFRIDLFADVEDFKQKIDAYVQATKTLSPLPGKQAFLPGGLEVETEKKYRRDGIPLSGSHRQVLEELAVNTGVPVPW